MIAGGGNVGTALAAEFAAKGHEVVLYTSRPEAFKREIQVEDEGRKYSSSPFRVTDRLAEGMQDAELAVITVPAFLIPALAEQMLPFARKGQKLLVMPGLGGAEYIFAEHVRKGALLYGLQRVPAVYRLIRYGESVKISGRRKEGLHVAAVPGTRVTEAAAELAELFGMPCSALPNYLCVTLTPSNPILHTTRLYSLFHDDGPGRLYDRNPYFYGDWDLPSAELLLACDEEEQRMLARLPELDLTEVRSLRLHYESETAEQLTTKIRGIRSLQGLTSPMKERDGRYEVDWDSRYFKADFPYGLAIIKGIASLVQAPVPNMDRVLKWYADRMGYQYYVGEAFCGKDLKATGIPQNYLEDLTREQFVSLYR